MIKRICSLLLSAGLIVLPACDPRADEQTDITSSPRFPDDQGVVTQSNNQELELDGARSYPISPSVQSFRSAKGHALTPIAHLKDRYVHIGIEDDAVVWIGVIGLVIPGSIPEVFYPGRFKGMDKGRAVFEDGTTLELGDVKVPSKGDQVDASIDPKTHKVFRLRIQEVPGGNS